MILYHTLSGHDEFIEPKENGLISKFIIDEVLNNEEVMDFDELDNVSLSIAERDYYQNTNK